VNDRNRLILDNRALVYWTYRRMMNLPLVARMGEDDAIGHGTIGLIKAADGFDAERGVKFSSYASWAIWREIDNASRSFGVTSLPRTSRMKGGPALVQAEAVRSVPYRMDRESTSSALADELACSIDVFAEVVEREQLARVREVVRWLPEPGRSVIELVYFHGKKHREAGVLLGMSRQVVSLYVRRSLVMLEEELAEAV
jgi:RNA polymerase sigma factor (sigma-70 family)